MLMRAQGRAVWRRFNAAVAAGRPPAREVLDGVLVIFGGAFLITPGFLTDVLGLVLLLPPTRALVRRLIVRHFSGRVVTTVFGRGAPGGAGAGGSNGRYDVEGTATEVEPPRLP
jgi:UPF0716 protein FxsA